MIRVTRVLGWELANRAFPPAAKGLDLGDAPRRLLVVALQLAIVVLVGAPLLAITQPFMPRFPGALLLISLLALLAISFWQRATNLEGHTRAAAQAIAEALARSTIDGRAEAPDHDLHEASALLVGLGSPLPVHLGPDSPAVGKTLAELNVRGLTGATILAIRRGAETHLVPAGNQSLAAGDVLALAGAKEATDAAKELLAG
jgi:CPA2 family monovalent cation:H+ antiporter-2